MTRPPTTTDWRDAIQYFSHDGPGGDEALAAQHPDLVAALHTLSPSDEPLTIGRHSVTRQTDGAWRVGNDRNLASPWVVVQSLRAAHHRRRDRSLFRERLRAPRDERGYTAVELLAMTTVLVGFITVVVGGGRFVDSNSQVDDAAYAAARAASLETNFEAGQMAGRKAAADALADRGKACTQLTVSFAGTDFRTSGHVSVEVTCHANLSDVVGFGLPGAKDFTSTAVVPIEQYRRLP
ncbi:TadE/TadG family type IV pilus assembly protein [Nocardioides aromaticivorans]|uniref:TadE/TadG family type IV pilus assembly protein n=1 Tax=Nocardioides aromaticivorans TaxID=200618 RepID=UPI001C5345EC|nr:TadE/TadG family type IV pilus assembly protein [Nocardioides aromaticivorans]